MKTEEKKKYNDSRAPFRGWAPGGYMCKCLVCKEQFIGGKRAYNCADCAYEEQSPQEVAAIKKAATPAPKVEVTEESADTQLLKALRGELVELRKQNALFTLQVQSLEGDLRVLRDANALTEGKLAAAWDKVIAERHVAGRSNCSEYFKEFKKELGL